MDMWSDWRQFDILATENIDKLAKECCQIMVLFCVRRLKLLTSAMIPSSLAFTFRPTFEDFHFCIASRFYLELCFRLSWCSYLSNPSLAHLQLFSTYNLSLEALKLPTLEILNLSSNLHIALSQHQSGLGVSFSSFPFVALFCCR